MFRYPVLLAICLFVCVFGTSGKALGQISNEDLNNGATFNAVARAYGAELNHRRDSRIDPDAQAAQIRNSLAHLSGRVVAHNDRLQIVWNAELGVAEIWYHKQQLDARWSVDALGRLSFYAAKVTGTVDVSGNLLFLELSARGPRQLLIAVIPDPGREMTTVKLCGKICACEVGTGGCDEDDCYNGQTCAGSNARCVYQDPPPAPPPGDDGGCGNSCALAMITIALVTAMPLPDFSRPRRWKRDGGI